MEYIDFKKLIDALTAKPKETEWVEFKHNFHSKEEIGEQISALSNSAYLSSMPFGYIVFGIDDETHRPPVDPHIDLIQRKQIPPHAQHKFRFAHMHAPRK